MQDFKKLLVWQRAHELALLTYRATAVFPRKEVFGLRNSLRKTSIDIPAYIAEGCGKTDPADFGKCIGVALALANRLEYYAPLARDLRILNEIDHDTLRDAAVEVRKMLGGLSRRLVS